ncbi:MAG: polysaccharide deacetylase family protein [bacterium]
MQHANGRQSNYIRVLTYHRVAHLDDRPWLNPGLISATPKLFERQMSFLAQNYNVVSMQEILDSVAGTKPLPRKTVLVTFDDAYRDFAENAWPILQRLRLPVTVFVPTAYPDQPKRMFWWDKLHQVFTGNDRLESTPVGAISLKTDEERRDGLKRLQGYIKKCPHEKALQIVDELFDKCADGKAVLPNVLGWQELRQLANDGVTLGAHTQTHPVLTRIHPEKAKSEMLGSQSDLQREIGDVLPIFSYPDGGHNQRILDILRDAGFVLGFNGPAGTDDLTSGELLRIRRINITPKSSHLLFRVRMSRWFSPVERFRHRKRIQEVTDEN